MSYTTVEIDLSDFEREILESLIIESCKQNISVNAVINNILRQYLDTYETSNL